MFSIRKEQMPLVCYVSYACLSSSLPGKLILPIDAHDRRMVSFRRTRLMRWTRAEIGSFKIVLDVPAMSFVDSLACRCRQSAGQSNICLPPRCALHLILNQELYFTAGVPMVVLRTNSCVNPSVSNNSLNMHIHESLVFGVGNTTGTWEVKNVPEKHFLAVP